MMTTPLDPCKVALGPHGYATLFDFKKACAYHSQNDYASVFPESGEAVPVIRKVSRAANKAATAQKMSPRKASQSDATVNDVQPNSRDLVHTVWLNGPTYSKKVSIPIECALQQQTAVDITILLFHATHHTARDQPHCFDRSELA